MIYFMSIVIYFMSIVIYFMSIVINYLVCVIYFKMDSSGENSSYIAPKDIKSHFKTRETTVSRTHG